jgi:soluble lytic murein transglycosylase-like protein
LLNGLGGLGEGLGTFAAGALKDRVNDADNTARAPLLNATPPESTPADPIVAAAPPAAGSTAVAGVPPELLPIYAAAAKRTGIPVDVLIAQGKQESGFNPNAVGSAGEIGLHQIKPSTGRDPGFGMRGIDPATLKDPTVNINFAADYLRARAGEAANLSNPADVNAALAAYNGGGDKNYVANVRQHIGAM